jgi:peptide/nickel transport system permease protein
MLVFIVQRVLWAIPVLLIVSFIVFGIFQLIPGAFCEEGLTSQRRRICRELQERFSLNQPFYVQYARWVENVILHGNFGPSFAQPFSSAMAEVVGNGRLANTLVIAISTLVLALFLTVPFALYCALRPYGWGDRIFSFIGVVGLSIPNFLIGLVMFEILVVWLQVGNRWNLPIGGLPPIESAFTSHRHLGDFLWHFWQVIVIAGSVQIAEVFRQLRGAFLDLLGDPYWKEALQKSRTSQERLSLYCQATGSALLSLLSWFALWLPLMFEGTMIASIVLNVPTMELTIWNAVRSQNVYVAIAGLMLLSTILIFCNLLVDIFIAMGGRRKIRYA